MSARGALTSPARDAGLRPSGRDETCGRPLGFFLLLSLKSVVHTSAAQLVYLRPAGRPTPSCLDDAARRGHVMDRRAFIGTLAGGLLAAPLAAEAQPLGAVARVGVLWPSAASQLPIEPFRQALRELGYVESQNVLVEYRSTEGTIEHLPALAAELVRFNPQVILTAGDPAIRAAKQASSTTPIVVAITGDLVATGHAASLARPGGNVTGLVESSPELSAKRVELLRAVRPNLSRVAVLWNGANPVKALDFKATQDGATALGLALQSLAVRDENDLEAALGTAARQVSAVVVLYDTFTGNHAQKIVDLVAKHRLTAIYGSKLFVDAGGLMSYGANVPDLVRRAAYFVDRILKSAKPGDLPIEQPTTFELVINLKTAKALSVTIPPSLLQRADRVIE